MHGVYVQVTVMFLPFLLQPVSYDASSGKVSLKSLGLLLLLLAAIGRQKENSLTILIFCHVVTPIDKLKKL